MEAISPARWTVRFALRGIFWTVLGFFWIGAIVLVFRADAFRSDAPRSVALLLESFTLGLLGIVRFLREVDRCATDFPYWPDEGRTVRDRLAVAAPALVLAVFLLIPFFGGFGVFLVLTLAVGEFLFSRYLPPLAERFFSYRRSGEEGSAESQTLTVVSEKTMSEREENPSESSTVETTKNDAPDSVEEGDCHTTFLFERSESRLRVKPQTPPPAMTAGYLPGLFPGDRPEDGEATIRFGQFGRPADLSAENDSLAASPDETWPVEEEIEEEPSEEIILSENRHRTATGEERIEGWFRVCFEVGQEVSVIYLSFCPPLCRVPELELIQLHGDEVRMKPTQVEPFGARIEIRRNDSAIADDLVRVCFFAEASPK